LDLDTEKCVNKVLELTKASAMILIIAHKDSALDICNRIYTIKDKSVFK
jgi:ABC-type transport system involved in cytochrome bd biosynthesis fused ATPase/permease subunit